MARGSKLKKLIVIYKKKTGNDIRDIHMKDPLLNLASRAALRTVDRTQAFPSIQHGLRKGGVEKIVHEHNALLSYVKECALASNNDSSTHGCITEDEHYAQLTSEIVSISLDFSKAFSNLNRACALQKAFDCEALSAIHRVLAFEVGAPAHSFAIKRGEIAFHALSSNGTAAGSVFGSILFAIGVQNIYEQIDQFVKTRSTALHKDLQCLTTACIDDLTITAHVTVIQDLLAHLSNASEGGLKPQLLEMGLTFNATKTQLISPVPTDSRTQSQGPSRDHRQGDHRPGPHQFSKTMWSTRWHLFSK